MRRTVAQVLQLAHQRADNFFDPVNFDAADSASGFLQATLLAPGQSVVERARLSELSAMFLQQEQLDLCIAQRIEGVQVPFEGAPGSLEVTFRQEDRQQFDEREQAAGL